MKRSRHRPALLKPTHAPAAPMPRAVSPDGAAAVGSPELPFRAWLLAGVTALLVARPAVPSAGVAWIGDGQPFCMLWLLLATLTCIAAVKLGHLPRRLNWLDALLLAFVVLYAMAAWRGMALGTPRPAINMLWEQTALAISFLLIRQLVWGQRETRMVVAAMLALALAMSVDGLYQVLIGMPADRAEFARDPEGMLRRSGQWFPPGSPERMAFENRLASTEPLATFALTNSLAGFLLPWITVAAGIALSTGTQVHRAGMAALAVLPAFCLLLTKSRSGYVALAVAIVLLLGNRLRQTLRTRAAWIIGGVILLVVAGAFVGGLLDVEIATEAKKSLGYRLQYWHSSLAMLRDRPLWGVGPGNFQDYYTAYKLPEASEEIRDPHNWILEIATTAGIPAAVLLGAFLLAALAKLIRSAPADESHGNGDPGSLRLLAAGAAGGLLVAQVVGMLAGFPPGLERLVVWGLLGTIVLWLLSGWVEAGTLSPRTLTIATIAMLVHLLASGGFLFPGVSGSLWLLLALGLNLAEPRPVPSQRITATLALAGCAGLTVAQYFTGYSPVLRSQSAIVEAQTLQDEALQRDAVLRAAAKADPWSAMPWQGLASFDCERWLAHPGPRLLDQFQQDADRFLALKPHSSSAHRMVGNWWSQIFERTGKPEHARRAVENLSKAATLYPNSAILRAELANALTAAGEGEKAKAEARAALQLDAATPHQDKKLPKATRETMEENQ